jgi:hypothetical protein
LWGQWQPLLWKTQPSDSFSQRILNIE